MWRLWLAFLFAPQYSTRPCVGRAQPAERGAGGSERAQHAADQRAQPCEAGLRGAEEATRGRSEGGDGYEDLAPAGTCASHKHSFKSSKPCRFYATMNFYCPYFSKSYKTYLTSILLYLSLCPLNIIICLLTFEAEFKLVITSKSTKGFWQMRLDGLELLVSTDQNILLN